MRGSVPARSLLLLTFVLLAGVLLAGCSPGQASGGANGAKTSGAGRTSSSRPESVPGTSGGPRTGSTTTVLTSRMQKTQQSTTDTTGETTASGTTGLSEGTIPVASTGRVSAVGDSVMLFVSSYLKRDIPGLTVVNAEVSRQVEPGVGVLQQMRAQGLLGDVVIVHLGTNGTFTSGEFDQIMQTLQGVRKVVFVNDAAPRPWIDSNNAVIAAGVARYPKRAVLADWHAASAGHPEYFDTDGVHLLPEGAQVYARVVASALAKSEGS